VTYPLKALTEGDTDAARYLQWAAMIPNHGPSLEFGLGDTADAIRETTARFAADKIAPIAAKIDETTASRASSGHRWASLACMA
jgi:hypothetical protein